MVQASYVAEIRRPPDAVFEAMTDVTQWHGWITALVELRDVPAEPIGVGSTFEMVTRFLGRTLVSDMTITEYEPGRRFVYKNQRPFPATVIWTMKPISTGTEVTLMIESEPGNALGPASPMLLNALNRAFEDTLARLKAALEQQPA